MMEFRPLDPGVIKLPATPASLSSKPPESLRSQEGTPVSSPDLADLIRA